MSEENKDLNKRIDNLVDTNLVLPKSIALNHGQVISNKKIQLHTSKHKRVIWVVLSKDKSTPLSSGPITEAMKQGQQQYPPPWHTDNERLAKAMAKECGGIAVDLRSAIKLCDKADSNVAAILKELGIN